MNENKGFTVPEELAAKLSGIVGAPVAKQEVKQEVAPAAPEEEKDKDDVNYGPLLYDDLMRGHIRQDVVISSKLKVTFQSLSGADDLCIKRWLSAHLGQTQDYATTWFSNATLAMSIVNLEAGGKTIHIPTLRYETNDDPEEKSVMARVDALKRLPSRLLDVLARHYVMFMNRVETDYTDMGGLKNG